jgi:xanthine dehydrogenase YagS FAD-binding subunit
LRPFAYERAASVAGAVAAVSGAPGARFLGGGTNLVDLMKLGVEEPAALVDLQDLPLGNIEQLGDGSLVIGGLVRNSELAADLRVRHAYPVLAQALLMGASGQLRNRATVAGNLMQRTRCSYFQDVSKPCNKRRPGSGCAARDGAHSGHAILGHSPACIATHPSDMAVAMSVLDARVHLHGPDGERALAIDELFRLPGEHPERDTHVGHGELIVDVELPPAPENLRSRYRKVRDRASFAFALVSIAVAVELDGDRVRDCHIALGGVAHAPWRARRAESKLRGAPAAQASFAAAAQAELSAAQPLRDNAYKVDLARNLLVQTLTEVCAP